MVTLTKRGMTTVSVAVVGVLAVGCALLVTDPTGAHLELAPLFVGAAVALAFVRASRARSRRRRD